MFNAINPREITDYNRSMGDLQRFLIFCICVAGKSAQQTAKKLAETRFWHFEHPFTEIFSRKRSVVTEDATLSDLTSAKIGQYNRILNALHEIAYKIVVDGLNLQTCSPKDLEDIKGIGPKTARFFILHSRPNQRVAVLDRHILRYMRENGIAPNAPKNTPARKDYSKFEKNFIDFCDQESHNIADMDLKIWKTYQKETK